MYDDVIEFVSRGAPVTAGTDVLEVSTKDGLKCTWSGRLVRFSAAHLTWKFNWEEILNTQRVHRITGQIIVFTFVMGYGSNVIYVDVDMTNQDEECSCDVEMMHGYISKSIDFRYRIFVEPDYQVTLGRELNGMNNTALMVEGKRLFVNKEVLSYYSEYFRALFSQVWNMQGQPEGLEIRDVSYQDFGLLMTLLSPEQKFPNDFNCERLLRLAVRFLMPFVTRQVENHLMNASRLRHEVLLRIADQNGFAKVLDSKTKEMNADQAERVADSAEFAGYSDDLKAKILWRSEIRN